MSLMFLAKQLAALKPVPSSVNLERNSITWVVPSSTISFRKMQLLLQKLDSFRMHLSNLSLLVSCLALLLTHRNL